MGSIASNPLFQWIFFTLLAGCAGLLLWQLIRSLKRSASHQSVDRINQVNDLLPQTQCGQCGYPGCRPYARAIINGAAINKCPPGGDPTIKALATLLNERPLPLDPAHGNYTQPQVALIREAECIGCTKCIQACPVDAILGAPKLMHTVISVECTGCALCVEPCPVDCIDMITMDRSARPGWPYPQHLTAAGRLEAPGNPSMAGESR